MIRRDTKDKPQDSVNTAGVVTLPLTFEIAAIISALVLGRRGVLRSLLREVRIMNGLPVRADAEQRMVDNQNDDRANNGDQDTVKI